MAISANSNTVALGAIRRLGESSDALSRTFERLSSGQRINRASDDPAGLSVSLGLGVKSRVLGRALLNANDGLSALSIADGALGQVSQLIERMGELAEQAANGTFTSSQRGNLNREYVQLDREIRRIGESVGFNGISLLKGGMVSNAVVSTGISNTLGNFAFGGTSADGRFLAVRSTDFTESVYFYDQVTGQSQLLATGGANFHNLSMSQNGDMVYSSRSTDQIFLRRVNGEIVQLTNGISASEQFLGLSMSGDGRFVAFTSRTIYTDGGSIDNPMGTGNDRIYRLDIETGEVRAMASDVGTVSGFQLSNDGSKLIFRSSTNLLSQGDGGTEFYAIDFNSDQLAFTQVTNGTGSATSARAAISDEGVVYLVDARNLNGLNSAAVQQIFSFNLSNNSLSALTNNTGNSNYGSFRLSADASTLLFTATNDAAGQNPSSYAQAFRWDFSTGTLSQLTNYTSNTELGAHDGIISGDGRRLFTRRSAQFELFTTDLSEGNRNINFELGFGAEGSIGMALQGLRGVLAGLGAYTLTSRSSSLAALDNARANLATLSQLRGQLGATSSRLTSAASLLTSQGLEIETARGRVRDIDVATESAALVRGTILQQVGASIVAQANLQPNLVLQLLEQ